MSASVLHSSEATSHGTPSLYVEAGRETLGWFDLDPTSWALQNRLVVKARRYFDERSNGYLQRWWGRGWRNYPGGLADNRGRRVIQASKSTGREACTVTGDCGLPPGHVHEGVQSAWTLFWAKEMRHYRRHEVHSAVVVCFNRNQLTTAVDGLPWPCQFPFCLPGDRVDYLREEDGELVPGGAPTHTSAFVLIPPHDPKERAEMVGRFIGAFGKFGKICGPIAHSSSWNRGGA